MTAVTSVIVGVWALCWLVRKCVTSARQHRDDLVDAEFDRIVQRIGEDQ